MALRPRRIVLAVVAVALIWFLWRLPVSQRLHDTHSEVVPPAGSEREEGHEEFIFTYPQHVQHPLVPLGSFIPLPKPNSTTSLPRIQHAFPPESATAKATRQDRLSKIKEAFLHSWHGYRSHAWLKDELSPVTGRHKTTLSGWAVTMIDSLDSLWLMGMKDEFESAIAALRTISFDEPDGLPINVFETTIRYLGGLLGAYDVSGHQYRVLLVKAVEVGNMLYPAFDTPNHMPVTRWAKIAMEVADARALSAELGTLTLEFTRLTQLTGDPKFYDAVQRIMDCFDAQQHQTRVPGLFPHTVNARDCWFGDGVTFSLGGSSDSVYEYFPKQHQLTGGASAQYQKLYRTALAPMKELLLFRPMTPSYADILVPGTLKAFRPDRVERVAQMQHLACFAGGMVALAAKLFDTPDELVTARKLVDGCIWAYGLTATGIMPEHFQLVACPPDEPYCEWDSRVWTKEIVRLRSKSQAPLPQPITSYTDRSYYLRPEAIESVFVLYRITGDEALRDAGWRMFEAITTATRAEFGFSAIADVTRLNPKKLDRMESFWTAETLKYFYLLFEDPQVWSLDDFVYNTEAHPFRLQR